jgi:hypothetical protein
LLRVSFFTETFEDVDIEDFDDLALIDDFKLLAAETEEQTDYLSS